MDNETLSLSAAARRAGVNVETIRYYQRRGLLPRPPRMHGAFRRYSPELVDRIRFIKRAQQLGFALSDVADLLGLAEGGTCSGVCGLAERKRDDVERKIADLEALRAALRGLVTRCRGNGIQDPCPLVGALAGNER